MEAIHSFVFSNILGTFILKTLSGCSLKLSGVYSYSNTRFCCLPFLVLDFFSLCSLECMVCRLILGGRVIICLHLLPLSAASLLSLSLFLPPSHPLSYSSGCVATIIWTPASSVQNQVLVLLPILWEQGEYYTFGYKGANSLVHFLLVSLWFCFSISLHL